MVKFIIEVSEEEIRKRADVDGIKNADASGKPFPRMMMDFLTFCALEKKLDEGVTEFVVNHDDLTEKEQRIYDSTLCDVAAAFFCCMKVEHGKSE